MPSKDDPKPLKDNGKVVDSNHNTTEPAKPVQVATITDPKEAKADYNPMRVPGGKANVNSDTSLNKDDNENIVDEKGSNATAAQNERERLNAIPEDELSVPERNARDRLNAEHENEGKN